ncbi:MAG: hypothetical protein NZ937_01790 [Armatimonadetes bacterium]|nr:hypothetical protein [Armatimonadota bacterium]
MHREVPAWLAAVIIFVVIIIVVAIYYFATSVRPQGEGIPTPEEVKEKMKKYMPMMKKQMPGFMEQKQSAPSNPSGY